MGRDDFVLVSSYAPQAEFPGATCLAMSRVQAPLRLNKTRLLGHTFDPDGLSADRDVRPWITTEAWLGHCNPVAQPVWFQNELTLRGWTPLTNLLANPDDSLYGNHMVTPSPSMEPHEIAMFASPGDVGAPGGSSLPATSDDLLLFSGVNGNATLLELGQGPRMAEAETSSSSRGDGTRTMGIATGVHRIAREENTTGEGLVGTVCAVAGIGDVTMDGSPDLLAVTHQTGPQSLAGGADNLAKFHMVVLHRPHSGQARAMRILSASPGGQSNYTQFVGGLAMLGPGFASKAAANGSIDGSGQAPPQGLPGGNEALVQCTVVVYGCTTCDVTRGAIYFFWIEHSSSRPSVAAVTRLAPGPAVPGAAGLQVP